VLSRNADLSGVERSNGTSWSGWATSATGDDIAVTSDRLDQADVENRWFPKVRSWIALGAPLELLSPLSVARVIGLVAVASFTVAMVFGVIPFVMASALTVLSIGGVVAMMKMRALTESDGPIFVGLTSMAVLGAVVASASDERVMLVAPLVGFVALYVGLFFRARMLYVAQASLGIVLLLAVRLTHDGMSFGFAGVLVLFSTMLASMTALTVRTSRMAGLFDPVTGLDNARGLEERVAQRARDCDLLIATVHLNGVDEVRDALGHSAASELVRRAVEDLGQVLPRFARVGRSGDDIVVLVSNETAHASSTDDLAQSIVRRIDTAIGSGRHLVGDIEVALSVNVGLSYARADDGSDTTQPGELLRQSAVAAIAARDDGRSIAVWDGERTTLTAEDLVLLADLRTGLERDELWIAYQPQVRTPDGRTVSVEALLRWTSPRHGTIPPGRFIPLAERTGFVDRLTDWVLAESLDAVVRWRDAGYDTTVSVNVSPMSLRSMDFSNRVEAELDERKLPSDVLMLEVTESMAFDVPEAVERLAPLRKRGVRISIDDFGTGYTSLAVLPHLPLDELKVDQQFVREAQTSHASEAIVRSVCELGHRLGLSVVAEGVEDENLAHLMTVFGFDLLQGYHFARPMAEPDLIEHLAAQDQFRHLTQPLDLTLSEIRIES